MDVKSQLKNAQIEHVTEATKGDPLVSRFVYATDTGVVYVGNGSGWISLIGGAIGDVKTSMLFDDQTANPAQGSFQFTNGSTWVLADGRDVTGSDYHILTGNQFIPDMRGEFLRGYDNGRGIDSGRSLGDSQDDDFGNHDHNNTKSAYLYDQNWPGSIATSTCWSYAPDDYGYISGGYSGHQYIDQRTTERKIDPAHNPQYTTRGNSISEAVGGSETRPRNVSVNYFIKIYK